MLSRDVRNTVGGEANVVDRDMGGVGMHEGGWEAAAGCRSLLERDRYLRDGRCCPGMCGSVGKGEF